jgi:hypothetical protein
MSTKEGPRLAPLQGQPLLLTICILTMHTTYGSLVLQASFRQEHSSSMQGGKLRAELQWTHE